MKNQMDLMTGDTGSSIGRNRLAAVLLAFYPGGFIGQMYAGFLARGVKMLILFMFILALSFTLINFYPAAGLLMLIATALIYPVAVMLDSYFLSVKGTIKAYHRVHYYIIAILCQLAFCGAAAFILRSQISQTFLVPTQSMEPGIQPDDRLFGGILICKLSELSRGDIVAFRPPAQITNNMGKSEIFMKRIVAVGGDEIEIREAALFVNGKKINEPYIKEPMAADYTVPKIKIPQNQVYLLGDNRNNSRDSRMFGPVPVENVRAKALYHYWPRDRIGPID